MQKKGKIAGIIQARMGSSRLPGKVISDIAGIPSIKLMINRLEKCQLLDGVIVATSNDASDDILCDFLIENNFDFFRGDETDVLKRVLSAAQEKNINHIVRLTGDCPLIDPLVVDKCVFEYIQDLKLDYISSTTLSNNYPRGQDVEVFSEKSLGAIDSFIELNSEFREHVSLYIYTEGINSCGFSCSPCSPLHYDVDKRIRLTLDYPEDYQLIKEIVKRIGHNCSLEQIVNLIKEIPELLDVNKKCHIEASYPNDHLRV